MLPCACVTSSDQWCVENANILNPSPGLIIGAYPNIASGRMNLPHRDSQIRSRRP